MTPRFPWPDLPDAVNPTFSDYCPEAKTLVKDWCDAFEGWEFDLPQAERLKVVPCQSFYSSYSGGVQLYTYIWLDGKWLGYAKGTPSELRRHARNFKLTDSWQDGE
jgi:hypothetical protein